MPEKENFRRHSGAISREFNEVWRKINQNLGVER